jgi:4-aminobutyrate aminotransferase-like enzyme/Ser/Thr protein kinase RdoA (MazF antagonist)
MNPLEHPRPAFAAAAARQSLIDRFGLEGELEPLDSERDQNFRVTSPHGRFVFKIVNAAEPADALAFQAALLRHVERHAPALPLPRVVPALDGRDLADATGPAGERHALRVVTYLSGTPMAKTTPTAASLEDLGRVLGELDAVLASFGHAGAFRDLDWHIGRTLAARARLDAVRDARRRSLLASSLDRFAAFVQPQLPRLRHSVIHNDANDWNVLVDERTGAISGLIDVGDAVFAPTIAELAVACAYVALGDRDRVARVAAVAGAYHQANPLAAIEIATLPDLIAARLCLSVSISAGRQATSSDPYLFVSEAPAWAALEWLASGGRDELAAAVREACPIATRSSRQPLPPVIDDAALGDARRRLLGPSLRLSYRSPLHIVAGEGVWLVAADGRRYLDCYNNVAHVGHCHPRVVAALAAQAARLNTNTRYLHENVVAYADRLRPTLPPALDTFFFVNSGSEANELALRLARTATGRRDVVVLDWAYHGHTQALVDVSPYKYKRAGGTGRPPFVTELPLPDAFRAPDGWPPADIGARFAAEARRHLAEAVWTTGGPAAAIVETIPSVAGQVLLPDGYLAELYAAARARGGLCIADEVQVGFGRVGSHMWAFQAHGVVPDVVTMGKPAGAGHPLGIVATTRAIAEAFANGMEYFNTFGGNPVSCAAGLAVLDVLEDERLLENATAQGEYLMARLRELADRHHAIGEVRGSGLFLGLEIVADRRTKAHDGATAGKVVERALALGVLAGTDGPYDNVIKLRPPMTFTRAHADRLVDVLDQAFTAAVRGPA